MSEMTKILDYLADQLIKNEHAAITKAMTEDERISFVNSVSTLQTHSEFIQKNTLWNAS